MSRSVWNMGRCLSSVWVATAVVLAGFSEPPRGPEAVTQVQAALPATPFASNHVSAFVLADTGAPFSLNDNDIPGRSRTTRARSR